MVETGGAIEPRDDRRQINRESPLVASAARALDRRPPPCPPGRHGSSDRLDDEQAVAAPCAFDEAAEQRLADGVRQLVDRERGDQRRPLAREHRRGDIGLARPRRDAERPVRSRRFAERPGMTVDADDGLRARRCDGPRSARRAGATAEIDDGRWRRRGVGQASEDPADEQKVQRAVEECERGALAGTRQRAASDCPTPLDVGGRKRPQRADDLRERQVGQVPRLEIRQPRVECDARILVHDD
jgi:hypothetical protein